MIQIVHCLLVDHLIYLELNFGFGLGFGGGYQGRVVLEAVHCEGDLEHALLQQGAVLDQVVV